MSFLTGRPFSVFSDLSLPEASYLYEKARLLIDDFPGNKEEFRIGDPDLGLCEFFFEDSTRTKYSFWNAADFHRIKHCDVRLDTSSLNKNESFADMFGTFIGYDNQLFVVRTKLEGLCTWLQDSGEAYSRRNGHPLPSFINAGDGKHQHPTQELLDMLAFLDHSKWNPGSIHVALIGDLYHGRTVHSKVDGLRAFRNVTVDLVAPDVLEMPDVYVDRMNEQGYTVRNFSSLQEYLSEKEVATHWYFTRPQLERMGDRVLQRADELRDAITFKEDYQSNIERLVKSGVKFFHPFPRNEKHPTLPTFLDETPLNGYERQSRLGYLMRIALLAAFAGKIGKDFEGEPYDRSPPEDNFVEEISLDSERARKDVRQGITPIPNGLVIDHICRGETPRLIRPHMSKIEHVMGFDSCGGYWIGQSENYDYKGLLFVVDARELGEKAVKRLAALAPGCTLNTIRDGKVVRKQRLHMPPRIYNFDDINCMNEMCISHPGVSHGIPAEFRRIEDTDKFSCYFCDTNHYFKQIWG